MTDTPYPTDTKRQAGQPTRACPTCGLQLSALVNECPQDGTRLPLVFENDPTFKHKYEFLETIGTGGMGVIYKARQVALNKIVAIKMLHAEMPSDDALRRFQLEGQTGSLLKHKYIIQSYDLGLTESGRPFMIMDYLQGKTLAQELSANGTLAEERFIRLFLQVTDALSHAHSKGVLHRDLKPSNLMLLQDNGMEEVRIMDFGIAKFLNGTDYGAQQLTKTGEALGSPLYMSPEQCRSGKVDRRADLYSLGCVMYEALTGAPPFIGSTSLETLMMHLEQQPLGLSNASLGREIDPGLQDIVMRLLQKDPADRYQSADDLEADLLKYQDATYGGKRVRFLYQEAASAPSKATSRLSKRQKAIGAVAITVFAGILTGFAFWWQAQTPQAEHTGASKLSEAIMTNAWQGQDLQKYLADPDVKDWVASKVATQPRDIVLDHWLGQIVVASNQDLESLRNATNAEAITFPKSSKIDDNGLQYVKDLKLTSLDVSETSVQKLTPLKKMDSLRMFDGSRTRLDTDGMRVLGGLHNLETLFITRTGIQDSDLELLKDLHKLKNLGLEDCSHITESGVARLHRYLPNLKITRESEASPADVAGEPANEADKLFVAKNYAQAEKKYAQILSTLNEQPIPNNKAIATFLKKRADCCCCMKQYARADEYYSQAKGLIKQTESPLIFASIIDAQAYSLELQFNSNRDRSALLKAIQLREKAIAIYDELHQYSLAQVDVIRTLGCDYAAIKEPAKAIKTLEKAISLFKKIQYGNCQQAGWSMNVLADVLIGQGRFDQAEKQYKNTLAVYRINANAMEPIASQRVATSLSYCEFMLKHYAEAEAMEMKLLAQKTTDKPLRLTQLDVMRQILHAQNKTQKAQIFDKELTELSAQMKAK
jgi:serine/threonine protein kinase/tetratricopeptide (TPR) repeat protein